MAPGRLPRKSPRKLTKNVATPPKGQMAITSFFRKIESGPVGVSGLSTVGSNIPKESTSKISGPIKIPVVGETNRKDSDGDILSSPEVVFGTPEVRENKKTLKRTKLVKIGTRIPTLMGGTNGEVKRRPLAAVSPIKLIASSSPSKASSCSPSFIAKRKYMAASPKKPFTISHLYSSPKAKRVRSGEEDKVMKESKNETASPVVTFADDLDRALFESLEESTSKDKSKPTRSLNFEAEKVSVIRSHALTEAVVNDFCWDDDEENTPDEKLPNLQFRYSVLEVESVGNTKKLLVQHVASGSTFNCLLEGLWYRTEVDTGDIVNVINPEVDAVTSDLKVNNNAGLFVVNPDFLMSGTAVMSGLFCRRKAVFTQSIRGTDPGSKQMILGIILHRIFQETLKKGSIEEVFLKSLVKSELENPSTLCELYGMGVSEADMRTEIIGILPNIVDWLRRYYGSVLTGNCVTSGIGEMANQKPRNSAYPQWTGKLDQIVDIEENIWSPRFGLKGKIDLSVKIQPRPGTKRDENVFPLELKTGRPSFAAEHTGQVILYSMMMDDRRRLNPGVQQSTGNSEEMGGLLVYLRDGSTATVKASVRERRDLVMLRNEMAKSFDRKIGLSVEEGGEAKMPTLPDPIAHKNACIKCPYIVACTAYQKAVEERQWPERHPMFELIPASVGHLSEAHLDYYRKWLLLLSLEREDGVRQNSKDDCSASGKELWTMTGREREKVGNCLSDMIVKPDWQVEFQGQRRIIHAFVRRVTKHGQSLRAAGLNVDDYVVVSSSDGIFLALTAGCVTRIGVSEICVALDRDLTSSCSGANSSSFRIDRMTIAGDSAFSICRGYLLQLLTDDPACDWLRRIIIDKEIVPKKKAFSVSKSMECRDLIRALNEKQQRAVLGVLLSQKYSLIRGVPGSGKTRLVVALLRVLAQRLKKSVLLVSYTHSAVDNVLAKILKEHPDEFNSGNVLRLGSASRIHSDVLSVSDEFAIKNARTVQDIDEIYSSKSVVATTCLSMGHPIFARGRVFDVCIVDEAAQALQLAAIGPLFAAERFVLVGDPHQLPPVVVSETASQMGMSESLFSRLDNPEVTTELSIQYRMNSEIMRLPNELTYGGRLRCGNDDVANATMVSASTTPEALTDVLSRQVDWMKSLLEPSLPNSVRFLSTHRASVAEAADQCKDVHGRIVNPGEAKITVKLVRTLLQMGIPTSEIGVITPFRAQVNLLRRSFKEGDEACAKIGGQDRSPDLKVWNHLLSDIEVNTVDQYQGRDKSVILFSCVRTSAEVGKKDILLDERRLNVAVTRAKHKLILIGNKVALTSYKPFKDLLEVLRSNQIVELDESDTWA